MPQISLPLATSGAHSTPPPHTEPEFIDANRYLDLYEVGSGKELLEALQEQKEYIFVSRQIVDEVMRSKLTCAERFFYKVKEIGEINAIVPDHLLGISPEKVAKLRSAVKGADDAKKEIRELAAKALSLIGRSEDDVSKRLASLFDKAVEPNSYEMAGARDRREHGNPPGEVRDPLGDQITWEQLLSHCKKTRVKRIWIVSNDGDYVTKFDRCVLLNPFFARELMQACGNELEIRCFINLMKAIKDFANQPGVTAKKLPTEQRSKEIEEELQALPSPGWPRRWNDGSMEAINQWWMAAVAGNLGLNLSRPPPLVHQKPGGEGCTARKRGSG
jgi:hypothetical protein